MHCAAQGTDDSEGDTFLGPTLINEWDVIPCVGQVNGKRVGGNRDKYGRMPMA
jgi:hypothetical protein